MVYSQNNEQQYILDYFKDFKGRFLDIGANDGKTLSNTAALADMGWSGVMVEPSPKTYIKCVYNYKENRNVKVCNYAISDKAGAVKFYEAADTLVSSMSEEQVNTWNVPYEVINVQCLTVNLLFHEIGTNFDFISIDAEGMDLKILTQMDLTNTKMICVEHGNVFEKEIKDYCESFGMKQIMRNFENILMAK